MTSLLHSLLLLVSLLRSAVIHRSSAIQRNQRIVGQSPRFYVSPCSNSGRERKKRLKIAFLRHSSFPVGCCNCFPGVLPQHSSCLVRGMRVFLTCVVFLLHRLVARMCMKVADIGHVSGPNYAYRRSTWRRKPQFATQYAVLRYLAVRRSVKRAMAPAFSMVLPCSGGVLPAR